MLQAMFAKLLGDKASDIIGGITGYGDAKRLAKRAEALRNEQYGKYTGAADDARSNTEFRPYSFTSSMGSVDGSKDGLNLSLSPEQQQLQDRLFGASGQFLDLIQGDPLDRAQGLFEKLNAIARPSEDRAALDLENRLRAQGRGALQIGAYGGTPEQLAAAIANAEGRNKRLMSAYGQAQNDRNQAGGMLSRLLQLGDSRNAPLMQLAQLGLQNQGLAQKGQLTGESLATSLLRDGLNTDSMLGLNLNALLGQKDAARSNFFDNLVG